MDVHMVWMKVMKDLKTDSNVILKLTSKKQRSHLSHCLKNMYELVKAAKYESPVYFHFALWQPGKGANWLSRKTRLRTILRFSDDDLRQNC
jgi:hypothetical protein